MPISIIIIKFTTINKTKAMVQKKNLNIGDVFTEESNWQKGLLIKKLVFAVNKISEKETIKYILCLSPEWSTQIPWFKDGTQLKKYIQAITKENLHNLKFVNQLDLEKTPVFYYEEILNTTYSLEKEVEVKQVIK